MSVKADCFEMKIGNSFMAANEKYKDTPFLVDGKSHKVGDLVCLPYGNKPYLITSYGKDEVGQPCVTLAEKGGIYNCEDLREYKVTWEWHKDIEWKFVLELSLRAFSVLFSLSIASASLLLFVASDTVIDTIIWTFLFLLNLFNVVNTTINIILYPRKYKKKKKREHVANLYGIEFVTTTGTATVDDNYWYQPRGQVAAEYQGDNE